MIRIPQWPVLIATIAPTCSEVCVVPDDALQAVSSGWILCLLMEPNVRVLQWGNFLHRGCEKLRRVQIKARVELAPQLEEKRCAQCTFVKTRSAFSVNRSIKGGRSSRCRQCRNLARRAQWSKEATLRAQVRWSALI